MAVEIERKFLLRNDEWRDLATSSQRMSQGYLGSYPVGKDVGRSSVRIRIAGEQAHINIKSRKAGHTRLEFEYPIPLVDAQLLLAECANQGIEKIRHWVPLGDLIVEVDEFLGANAGLIVAEVELTEASQEIPAVEWLGAEVTERLQYYNTELAKYPFNQWSSTEQQQYQNHYE